MEGKASARAAILNRPSALNALNTNMVFVSWILSLLDYGIGSFSFSLYHAVGVFEFFTQ